MNRIIVNEVKSFLKKRNSDLKLNEYARAKNLFTKSLTENSDMQDTANKTANVIAAINNGEWENDPYKFYESLKKSKHFLMLTDYTPTELSQMKLFKLIGFNIGFALKKHDNEYNEIVAVHNNEPEVKGIGKVLMQAAIDNGGCFLDHFDGFLSGLYQSMGFVEYNRDKYDPQYDPEGNFSEKYGQSDVIYRVHNNCKNKLKTPPNQDSSEADGEPELAN